MRAFSTAVVLLTVSACDCGGRAQTQNGELRIEPGALDFGALLPGEQRTLSLQLRSVGIVAVSVDLDGPLTEPFSLTGGALPVELAPSTTSELVLSARPSRPGAFSGSLRLTTDSRLTPTVVVPLLVVAFASDAGVPDAGLPDAGLPDAGLPDAGLPDAGLPDAGLPDAGLPDAGLPDAGLPDAGSWPMQLATTRNGTCVRNTDGGVQCWGTLSTGNSASGMLSTWFSMTPESLPVGGVAQAAGGADHLCLLGLDRRVACMGSAIGRGLPLVPGVAFDGGFSVVSPTPSGITSLTATGWGTCALTGTGEVWCWGHGELNGQPSAQRLEAPQRLNALPPDVVSLASSLNTACAVTRAGAVWCWGLWSAGVTEGLDAADGGPWSFEPRALPFLDAGLSQLALEDEHGCGILFDGGVTCWGLNGCGQLGNGTRGPTTTEQPPQQVQLPAPAVEVSVRSGNSCAVLSNGALRCWGCAQPGDGTLNGSPTPTPALVPTPVRRVVSDPFGSHSCALTASNRIYCWGDNTRGQLGRTVPFLSNLNETPALVVGY